MEVGEGTTSLATRTVVLLTNVLHNSFGNDVHGRLDMLKHANDFVGTGCMSSTLDRSYLSSDIYAGFVDCTYLSCCRIPHAREGW